MQSETQTHTGKQEQTENEFNLSIKMVVILKVKIFFYGNSAPTFCVDIGRHRITRFCEVLETVSMFAKYWTEKTNELLEL